MIKRFYDNLGDYLVKAPVVVIYGARQVGKTTLVKSFLEKTALKWKYLAGEDIRVQETLSSKDLKKLKEMVEGYDLLAVDEAQYIHDIGLSAKMIVDYIPKVKLILTGSSSFELCGQVGEPLTGRKFTIELFPISLLELRSIYNPYEIKEKLNEFLIYGMYPKVLDLPKDEKIYYLNEIVGSYLLKDILAFEKIKNSMTLLNLLKLLAYQLGKEVSLSELAQKLHINVKTVARYLDLLEKSYIIFQLKPFKGNLRKAISEKSKYYFYDVGIRNAIIEDFREIEKRDPKEVGDLFENFFISEYLKKCKYTKPIASLYFYRDYEQKEVDLIERDSEGNLRGFEIKLKAKEKGKPPKELLEAYPELHLEVVDINNFIELVAA